MASGFTDAFAAKALDHFFGNTAYSQPANLFIGLATADPGATATLGSVAEPSGNAYARVNLSGLLSAAGSGSKTNGSDIVFPAMTPAAWGTISHYFITDGTDVIWTGAFGTARVTVVNDVVKILAGNLALTLARSGQGGFTTNIANKLLDHMFKGTAYSQPAALKVGLATADPGAASAYPPAAEVSTGGGSLYARQTILGGVMAAAGATVAAQIRNASAITFPVAGANWGTITHWFTTDDSATTIAMGQLDASQVVNTSDQFQFATGVMRHALART